MEPHKGRVLLITPHLKSQRGNTITTCRIARGLKGLGFSIEVVQFSGHEDIPRVEEKLLAKNYNLIHFFHGLFCGRALSLIPTLRAIPTLLTTTGTDLHGTWNKVDQSLISIAFDKARELVVFNESFIEILVKNHCILEKKVKVIPQGVTLEAGKAYSRLELGIEEEAIVFLLPSGLRPVKNLELAIRAFKRISFNKNTYLIIVGTMIDIQYGERILNLIGEDSRIKYLGEIPHQDMAGLIRVSDIVLNTSKAEGQPQGALEAMSLGKPALLSTAPGNLGVMNHGVEGFYIDSEEDLLEIMEKLIPNAHLRIKLGQKAKELVEKKFSPEVEIEAYRRIYERLLTD